MSLVIPNDPRGFTPARCSHTPGSRNLLVQGSVCGTEAVRTKPGNSPVAVILLYYYQVSISKVHNVFRLIKQRKSPAKAMHESKKTRSGFLPRCTAVSHSAHRRGWRRRCPLDVGSRSTALSIPLNDHLLTLQSLVTSTCLGLHHSCVTPTRFKFITQSSNKCR